MAVTINGGTGVTIGSGAAYTFGDNSTQTSAADPADFGFKNRIINGAMVIAQRNAGASVTVPAATVTYTVDRWAAYGSQASKFTVQQSSTAPTGFTKSTLITSLSAYAIGSSDVYWFRQPVEGFNVADLAWGTASAAAVTLSFWVRSSLTGTFGGSVSNASWSYPFSYTISAANTWEQKTVTIAGSTSGTWSTDNTASFYLQFGLGVGSTYSSTAGSWQAANYVSATGATSVVGTNGATFYITGVQLEKNTGATGFDVRPYGTELALCQRYYEKGWLSSSSTAASATSRWTLQFKVTKRTAPTNTYTIIAGQGSTQPTQNYADAEGAIGYSNGSSVGDYTQWSWTSAAEL
jgi:hypothetical protein